MKRIAIILSGCGFKDGSEITEAVGTLIHLSELGAEYKIFAPNLDITSVNHINNEPGESRNLLKESARIARGEVEDLNHLKEPNFDGLVFPGGFGAALHLCNFAHKGVQCDVLPEVKQSIEAFHKNSKPIAAICIAPALIAKVLGEHRVALTIGNDKATAKEIQKTGAQHIDCKVDDYITDRENKLITTPAYMYEAKPHEVFTGIKRALQEFYEMA